VPKAMIAIYSSDLEIDVSGTLLELKVISEAITTFANSEDLLLSIPANQLAEPAPYDLALPELVFTKANSAIQVTISKDNVLVVSGSGDNLIILASYFLYPQGSPNGHHAHFEYFPGIDHIVEDAIPLIITVNEFG
jgi:hypothetical protein